MTSSPIDNPFTSRTIWGREKELSIISSRLLSHPPQSIVIIGEPYIGKTGLVRRLMQRPLFDNAGVQHSLTFVFLDCALYLYLSKADGLGRDMDDFASARFWWDLYNALPDGRQEPDASSVDGSLSEPKRYQDKAALIDAAYEIKSRIEERVRAHHQPVIFIFDNFEGLACLPLRNSQWLRAMAVQTGNCAYIATSRYILYLLYSYHLQSWADPSPLWNIFSDPIYLGLWPVNETEAYLERVARFARESGYQWCEQDSDFARERAGRHLELLRMACARLFEYHQSSHSTSDAIIDEQDYTFLSLRLAQDAAPLCNQLWQGLANAELYNLPGVLSPAREEQTLSMSPYQRALTAIAHHSAVSEIDTKVLFELNQRGLIERINGEWRVFSGLMREFVLAQEQAASQAGAMATAPGGKATTGQDGREITSLPERLSAPTAAEKEDDGDRPLTYMEGRVYEYLKMRLGEVCDRMEIMQAVWGDNDLPTHSALQKIIERIRQKIRDDPDSPYKLIAVRGRGYMLRKSL